MVAQAVCMHCIRWQGRPLIPDNTDLMRLAETILFGGGSNLPVLGGYAHLPTGC
jgi:hypothetical protein